MRPVFALAAVAFAHACRVVDGIRNEQRQRQTDHECFCLIQGTEPAKSGSDAAFWWGIERTRARMRFAAACASTWQRKEQEQQIVLDSTISSRFTIQCCWQLGDIQGAI